MNVECVKGVVYMKKNLTKVAIFLSVLIVLSGCARILQPGMPDDVSPPDDQPPAEALELNLEDYILPIDNARYNYEGTGMEYAQYSAWADYRYDDALQIRTDNGGTVMASVYRFDGEKLIRTFSQGETYHREDLTQRENNSQDVILMKPLAEGTSWILEDGSKRTITGMDMDVETPSGSYKAIEVTTEYKDSKTFDYYVKGTGLVKSVFSGDDYEVISALESIESDFRLTQDVKLYYPDAQENIISVDAQLEFGTNDSAEKVLVQSYRDSVPSDALTVFAESAEINSVYFDQETSTARIDLSRSFITEMNAGSYYESLILQSLADTLRSYGNSEKISVTVDGGAYESGHMLLEKEDYIWARTE